jgi:hypothetical protein
MATPEEYLGLYTSALDADVTAGSGFGPGTPQYAAQQANVAQGAMLQRRYDSALPIPLQVAQYLPFVMAGYALGGAAAVSDIPGFSPLSGAVAVGLGGASLYQPPTAGTPPGPVTPALPTGADAGTPVVGSQPTAGPRGPGDSSGPFQWSALGGISLRSLLGIRNKAKTTAQLEAQLLKRYYGSLGKAVARAIGSAARAGAKIVSPNIDKLRAASKPLSSSKALSTVIEPLSRFPWLGTVGGFVGGMIFPTVLGSGELSARDRYELLQPITVKARMYDRPERWTYPGATGGFEVPDFKPVQAPEEVPLIAQIMRGYVTPRIPEPFRDLLPERFVGPPMAATEAGGPMLPAEVTATIPAPRNVAPQTAARKGILGRFNQQTLKRAQLAGAAVGLLAASRKKSSAPSVAAVIPSPMLTTNTNTSITTLLASAPYASSSTSIRSAGCSCKPKKRGPQRKCLERASVVYRTGRYKGKAAGTKCIRYAT